MPLYHENVPQYDDVLNNKEYLKFQTKIKSTDLELINNHFQNDVS